MLQICYKTYAEYRYDDKCFQKMAQTSRCTKNKTLMALDIYSIIKSESNQKQKGEEEFRTFFT